MKNKLMEYTWLTIAILSLSIGIFETFSGRFNDNYRFYIFFTISFLLYIVRRNQRRSQKVKANQKPEN
jgi:hypothetical protein